MKLSAVRLAPSLSQGKLLLRARSLPLSRDALALIAVLSAVAAYNFVTLLHPIQPYFDDGWYASRSWAVLHTGYAFGPMDNGALTNFQGYWTYFWLLGHWIDSWFIQLFGPTLFAVRFVSLLSGLVLLVLAYLLAARLYGRRAGILTVIIGASSAPFLYSSHVGRTDIMVAAFGYGALALYVYQQRPSFTLASFISGLALSLTLDIHPIGIVFPAVIIALLLLDYRLKVFRVGRTWGFLLGYLLGVAYYLIIHVLPYPATFFAISRLQQGSNVTTSPILTMNPQVWAKSLWETFSMAGSSTAGYAVVLMLFASVVLLFGKRTRSDIKAMVIFGVLILAFASVVPLKPQYYAILLAPAGWLLLAAGTDRLLLPMGEWRRSLRSMLVTSIAVIVFTSLGIRNSVPLWHDSYPDFKSAMQFVRQTAPPGTSVMAMDTYWLARPEDPFFVWEQFSIYRRYKPGSTLEEAFRALHPDYLILDGQTDHFLIDDSRLLDNNVVVMRTEMESFLHDHTLLTAQEHSDIYGLIRIYRIDWNSLK